MFALVHHVAVTNYAAVAERWFLDGGFVVIVTLLYRIGNKVGTMEATVKSIGPRVDRLEANEDRRNDDFWRHPPRRGGG